MLRKLTHQEKNEQNLLLIHGKKLFFRFGIYS